MRNQANQPATTHDRDLLPINQAEAFRTWLNGQGIKTRPAKPRERAAGTLYWALIDQRWVSVDDSCTHDNPYAATHFRLRPLIDSFLIRPIVTAVKRVGREVPQVSAKAVLARMEASKPVVEPAPAIPEQPMGYVPARIAAPAPAPAAGCSGACQAAPAKVALSPHLEDLRDDFALHAPLRQEDGETLESFAVRRWAYAEAMMAARPV